MTQEHLNSALRAFVKKELSPQQSDISFISTIYESYCDILGDSNCLQIGSVPRYTAVRPLHDLDILYKLGQWNPLIDDPSNTLSDLLVRIRQNYVNPTSYRMEYRLQTHSIAILYLDEYDEEVFAVDIVPAHQDSHNEFGQDTFMVPEIINIQSYQLREEYYENMRASEKRIPWIKTDPLGYITIAREVNSTNSDFRKSVKFVKGWKNACKAINASFRLKSFHLEQLVTEDYLKNSNQDLFESLFEFYTNLKEDCKSPRIRDRADKSKFIDSYLEELKDDERILISQAIDALLKAMEEVETQTDVEQLIHSGFYKRKGASEEFLFDQGIPVLTVAPLGIVIDGLIQDQNGYREYKSSLKKRIGHISKNNQIKFKVISDKVHSQLYKWKIRNDDATNHPRGEISDNRTRQYPERTAYTGRHYAECYGIVDGVCVAKDRIEVIVD